LRQAHATRAPRDVAAERAVVGAWLVHAPDAPFAWHLFAFHADGIAVQSNPQRPDSTHLDSLGVGHWRALAGGEVRAELTEVRALRSDGTYAGTGEITLMFRLDGCRLTGRAETAWVTAEGQRSVGPETTLVGQKLGGHDGIASAASGPRDG
jgi:hypothetical protein